AETLRLVVWMLARRTGAEEAVVGVVGDVAAAVVDHDIQGEHLVVVARRLGPSAADRAVLALRLDHIGAAGGTDLAADRAAGPGRQGREQLAGQAQLLLAAGLGAPAPQPW